MFWVGRTKPIAKSTQRGNVYIFHIIMVYQDTIVPCIIRVAYHCFYLLLGAMIISFMIPLISSFV